MSKQTNAKVKGKLHTLSDCYSLSFITITILIIGFLISIGKKVKDKNAPKKPISAFFCYQSKEWYQRAHRPIIKKEQPNLNNKLLVAVKFF